MPIVKPTPASKKAGRKSGSAGRPAGTKAQSASVKAGAKFGGIHKRKPQVPIHRLSTSAYRSKPHFSQPRMIATPSVTLKEAYRSTDLPEIRTARGVQLMSIQKTKIQFPKGKLKGFQGYRARTFTTENSHRHEVVVFYEPDKNGDLRDSSRVVSSCTCARHLYMWEYANARVGLSFIYYSNGQPPVQTNPRMYPSLCKHGLVTFGYLLRKRATRKHEAEKSLAQRKVLSGRAPKKAQGIAEKVKSLQGRPVKNR